MTWIQLGPLKESDLSAKITSPRSAVTWSSLSCWPPSFDSSLCWILLSFPVEDINNRLVAGAVTLEISCDEYSGHMEETFAERILISGRDLLKTQHTTIRSTAPQRKDWCWNKGVAIVCCVFNKLGLLMSNITVSSIWSIQPSTLMKEISSRIVFGFSWNSVESSTKNIKNYPMKISLKHVCLRSVNWLINYSKLQLCTQLFHICFPFLRHPTDV